MQLPANCAALLVIFGFKINTRREAKTLAMRRLQTVGCMLNLVFRQEIVGVRKGGGALVQQLAHKNNGWSKIISIQFFPVSRKCGCNQYVVSHEYRDHVPPARTLTCPQYR